MKTKRLIFALSLLVLAGAKATGMPPTNQENGKQTNPKTDSVISHAKNTNTIRRSEIIINTIRRREITNVPYNVYCIGIPTPFRLSLIAAFPIAPSWKK